jgi:hypothetical protein
MIKGRLFIAALLASGLLLTPAHAAVDVSTAKIIIVKEIVPPDAPMAPAPPEEAATPPQPPTPPAPPHSRPGPRKMGPATEALSAPATLGAKLADFMARAIARGFVSEPAPAQDQDAAG